MPAHNAKGTTERTLLRITPEERAIVERLQQAWGAADIKLSLNDVIRAAIRRTMIVRPTTFAEADALISKHTAECTEGCSTGGVGPGCVDGRYIAELCQGVRQTLRALQEAAQRPAAPAPVPAPRPAAPAPQKATQPRRGQHGAGLTLSARELLRDAG